MSTINIRTEEANDIDIIFQINSTAFDTAAEAELVNRLREQAEPFLSLVAEQDGTLLGHLLLTPVTLDADQDNSSELKLMGLAPMAVMPDNQNSGIGSALVEAGLTHCRNLGIGAVVVLGHPEYYPRFGFEPSVNFNIKSEYEVPAEVFMAQELLPGYLQKVSGTIQYHPAFNEL